MVSRREWVESAAGGAREVSRTRWDVGAYEYAVHSCVGSKMAAACASSVRAGAVAANTTDASAKLGNTADLMSRGGKRGRWRGRGARGPGTTSRCELKGS